MVTKEIGTLLRNRADRYRRDSEAFAREGDKVMAAAYRAIADELRQCAKEISGGVERTICRDDTNEHVHCIHAGGL